MADDSSGAGQRLPAAGESDSLITSEKVDLLAVKLSGYKNAVPWVSPEHQGGVLVAQSLLLSRCDSENQLMVADAFDRSVLAPPRNQHLQPSERRGCRPSGLHLGIDQAVQDVQAFMKAHQQLLSQLQERIRTLVAGA